MKQEFRYISSRQNPEVKGIVALHGSRERHNAKKFIAEGLRTCKTLSESAITLHQLYVTQTMLESVTPWANHSHITLVSDSVMAKITQSTTPSGILGIFHMPAQPPLSQLSSGLVLANLQDPGNVGTLIRSCAAFNIKTVVIIDGVDPWSAKVVQSSAGTLGQVDIFSLSWQELIQHKGALQLCALVVAGGKKPGELKNGDFLLVVGNEAAGIPSTWIAQCDATMTLPMPGNTESLNAAVAGSLALYLTAVGVKK